MARQQKSQIVILMESLKPPIREAMRKDPALLQKAFSLEARIAMAEILRKNDELVRLLTAYHILSREAKDAMSLRNVK